MSKLNKAAFIAVLMTSTMPMTAFAQGTGADAASADDNAGEIVVTARRREEALSKVPIAVTAISAEMLASKSIQNENDLQAAVPGLVVKQSGNANAFNYVIRGQTIDTYTNSPPGVLPYINEAQIATFSASTFYDLAGVQVLKGPQGTLFGRNTTGGAVLYQTAKPGNEFGGFLKARVGNLDAYQIEGAIDFPISDAIKLRVAGTKVGGGAYVRRLDTGKRYGNLEQESIRGTLVIEPTDGFRNTLVVQHTNDGGTNAPGSIYHSSAYACGNTGGHTSSADCLYSAANFLGSGKSFVQLVPNAAALEALKLGVVGLSNAQDKMGPYKVFGVNSSLRHDGKTTFAINTTEFDLNSDMTLKNIFSYNRSWSNDKNDYDGSPFPLIGMSGTLTPDLTGLTNEGDFYNRVRQISNELQLQGKALDSRLDYTVGIYYINQKNLFNSEVTFFDFYPLGFAGANVHYIQQTQSESYAVFAQGSYALTDQLNLTVGGRYTRDTVKARQLPGSDWYGCLPATCHAVGVSPDYREQAKTKKPSWNVSLDYRIAPSLMVYATTRGSWRSGGFNYSLAPNPALADQFGNRFLPETTRDVELGLKYSGRDLGVPATFNIAAYSQWVKNIQRGANLISPVTNSSILLTVSVPKAKIQGIETDFTVSPTDWLNLGGSLTYTDAKFTDNQVSVPGNPPLVYGPYADVPKWSGSAFAEISQDLGQETGKLAIRGDFYFQSKSYFGNLGALIPGTDIKGYELISGRVTWSEIMGSQVSLALYGRNLANTKYYSGGNPTGYSAGFNHAFAGSPRTYGVEAKVAF